VKVIVRMQWVDERSRDEEVKVRQGDAMIEHTKEFVLQLLGSGRPEISILGRHKSEW